MTSRFSMTMTSKALAIQGSHFVISSGEDWGKHLDSKAGLPKKKATRLAAFSQPKKRALCQFPISASCMACTHRRAAVSFPMASSLFGVSLRVAQ